MSAPKSDNLFSSDHLQILLNNFSCNLSVINDLHRVAEENVVTHPDLVCSMLIAMRRYLDDFDSVYEGLDALVLHAEEREKDGKREKGGTK